MRRAVFALQIMAKGTPRRGKRRGIKRRSAGDTANAIGSEKLFGHGRGTVSSRAKELFGTDGIRGIPGTAPLDAPTQAAQCRGYRECHRFRKALWPWTRDRFLKGRLRQ